MIRGSVIIKMYNMYKCYTVYNIIQTTLWSERMREKKEKKKQGEREREQYRTLTAVLRRYDMSSDSPSGGMKEMVRSFSKRERRTHW